MQEVTIYQASEQADQEVIIFTDTDPKAQDAIFILKIAKAIETYTK
jgi:hypothetical protein